MILLRYLDLHLSPFHAQSSSLSKVYTITPKCIQNHPSRGSVIPNSYPVEEWQTVKYIRIGEGYSANGFGELGPLCFSEPEQKITINSSQLPKNQISTCRRADGWRVNCFRRLTLARITGDCRRGSHSTDLYLERRASPTLVGSRTFSRNIPDRWKRLN